MGSKKVFDWSKETAGNPLLTAADLNAHTFTQFSTRAHFQYLQLQWNDISHLNFRLFNSTVVEFGPILAGWLEEGGGV